MWFRIKKKLKIMEEIIQMCEKAIIEWEENNYSEIISAINGDSRNKLEPFYNLVKNTILPEIKEIMVYTQEKRNLKKIRENRKKYYYRIIDCWNYQAPLTKLLLELF